jgi:uridine kinase
VTSRRELIENLAERAFRSRLVGIDGPDAAGKTTLADELARSLSRRGIGVGRVSLDDFLRPEAERYRAGRESPEGYYRDSFDHDRFRAAVCAEAADVVVADGIFLLRPELRDLWDLTVFVTVEEDEILRRAARRDGPKLGADLERLYRRRYLTAQRSYRETVGPEALADIVIDNTDPMRPRLKRR